MQDNKDNLGQENRIGEILGRAAADFKSGKNTRRSTENGSEEFVFSGSGTALVFDSEHIEDKPQKAEEPAAEEPKKEALLEQFEANVPRVESAPMITREEKKVIDLEKPASADEFSLPNSFVVDEKYNTPLFMEDRPRSMFHTYVPTFTEASENYRMADEVRPTVKPTAVAQGEEALAPAAEPALDPTAENDREVENAVLVGSGVVLPSEEDESAIRMQKPIAPASHASVPVQPTVESERAQIEELLRPSAASEPIEEPQPEPAPIEESVLPPVDEPVAREESEPKKPYEMPDPEEGTVRVFDYPRDIENPPAEPELSVAPLEKGFFKQKEYLNPEQKTTFKDMFLDRLNSVAVRFGAALLLTLILCFIENISVFGVDAVALLGFAGFPLALSLLDMQIVIVLLLLAAPEIMRGVRALTKGLFHTELLLPIAFLLQILHTVAVMISRMTVSHLYGFVFGLFALATIGAAYLRHRASFVTFNHVGGRDEKFAVEKRSTRLLEKEKFALDGAVDEYKSKTASVRRASFVADFFARERKSAENTRFNLTYLLVSLGVSLVAAVVMYFIGEGMISAISTLLITFYLSAPAVLLLAHRLPYYLSARLASSRGGGVIGETSHYEYAGVDVVTFKDTEVFEQGDVAIQHIVLYDKAKDLSSVIEQMSSIFSCVGGPLEVLFSSSVVKKCPRADEAVFEGGGIFARIKDATFHVGTEAYLASKDIDTPTERDNRETVDNGVKILYAAENGRVFAKFYLRYRLSSRFSQLLSFFVKEKIVSLVYTKDPNVTDAMMLHFTDGRDCIRVIRDEEKREEEAPLERISVGLVSSKDKTSAISLLLLCRRYVKMQKNLVSAFWLALGSGAFLGAMLSIFGLLYLPSAAYGLWEAALSVALFVYAIKTLDPSGKSNGGGNTKK